MKKNGVPVRGRFQLWVNLPPEKILEDARPRQDNVVAVASRRR